MRKRSVECKAKAWQPSRQTVATAFCAVCVYHGSNIVRLLRHLTFAKQAQPSATDLDMNSGRQFVLCLVVLQLLFTVGCLKKPPQLPTQANAPAEVIPSPLPVEISEAAPAPPPPPAPTPQPPPAEEPKPTASAHRRRKPTPPAITAQSGATGLPATSSTGTTTVAAAHPPANPAAEVPHETAIGADVSSAQLAQQKQTTKQLLDETEKTLGGLNRALSKDDEEVVAQIRSYVTQSRSATKEGDFERAYNLATKAHLLSAALIKK